MTLAWVLSVCACTVGGLPYEATLAPGADDQPESPSLAEGRLPDEPIHPPPGPPIRPTYGKTILQKDGPPPVSGGTLAVTPDGKTAFAADPDRDRIYAVDVASGTLVDTIGLVPGDEPGRVAIDGSNRAHVVLRGGGAIVTVDLATHTTTRRQVCAAPRGVAYDPSGDRIHVTCWGGALVTLPAAGGPATRRVMLERDLWDVVVAGSGLYVTKLKSAELLRLDENGAVVERKSPNVNVLGQKARPFAAWRTIAQPNGEIWMLHQAAKGTLHAQVAQGGYGSVCIPAVPTMLTVFSTKDRSVVVGDAVVAQDVAPGPKPNLAIVPSLGNAHSPQLESFVLFDARVGRGSSNCHEHGGPPPLDITGTGPQYTSVAATGTRTLLLSREPARLRILDSTLKETASVVLSDVTREDTGHAIFHANAGAGIACATCHLEGGEDGLVWMIDGEPRRTPSLRGTVAGTAPYHWRGDLPDIDALVADVYAKRMNGGPLSKEQTYALERWLGALPPPPRVAVSPDAAARGKLLFAGKGGCSGCHNGPKLTDNTSHVVGTSVPLQTPSLIGVGARAPYLHDGCAKLDPQLGPMPRAMTLADRFDPRCRAGSHGNSLDLTLIETSDLIAYLETL